MIDTKKVPRKYRPIPFWSWNENLSTEETHRQAAEMARIGMGGYFMHARSGLQTPYMGDEWFENIAEGIQTAEEYGMTPWAYDENGWPSGFGDGVVNAKGLNYQQKYLRTEKEKIHTETSIGMVNGIHFYYEVNPYYVDVLDKEVIRTFLEEIYQPYYERFQTKITGFFTDEPQISVNGIPWSFVLPDAYRNAYGEELLERLPELFEEIGDYKTTRIRFWKLITDIFSESYMKQIYDWCDERGLQLTGHLRNDVMPSDQVTSNGACMPHYEYMHIPGVDKLSREIEEAVGALGVSSVAHQLGRKQILTESYAGCGQNVSFSELRGLLEWQMVRGVNLLCPHLEGYSLRGKRKRDWPPAMYEQQPWWEEYSDFLTAMSRVGMILAEGDPSCDTLLIHPQTDAWICYNNSTNPGLYDVDDRYVAAIHALDRRHIQFHVGDETIMHRHGKVDGAALQIGCQTYKRVCLQPNQTLLPETEEMIRTFAANGGEVVTDIEALAENPVTDNPNLTYTARKFGTETVHYFVNVTGEEQFATFACGGKRIDIDTGEIVPFDGTYDFLPFDSILVLDDGSVPCAKEKNEKRYLDFSGDWKIVEATENALTLDRCDYYFDGELQEENGYVLNIQGRAMKLGRPIDLKQVYRVKMNALPKKLWLVCETPEKFEIAINGKPLSKNDDGFFRDRSFRKIPADGYWKIGENEIVVTSRFAQEDITYENMGKSWHCETEKNKLTYDMEAEALYLLGDFAVVCEGTVEDISPTAVRMSDDFAVEAPQTQVKLSQLQEQGFPFFAGRLTVEKTIDKEAATHIRFKREGINAVLAEVNGHRLTSIWNGEEFDLRPYLREGENVIRLQLVNNLHNLLGPHHLNVGESRGVSVSSFYKEKCVCCPKGNPEWNDGYSFVKTGLE